MTLSPFRCSSLRSFGAAMVMVVAALGAAACTHAEVKRDRAPVTPPSAHCQMARAGLKEATEPDDDQLYALDATCIRSHAMIAGRIYVDARFGDRAVPVPERACAPDDFIVRFDSENAAPAASADVVLLLVEAETTAGWPFSVSVEEANWRSHGQLRAPPVCGTAFGTLRESGGTWKAILDRPPKPPWEL